MVTKNVTGGPFKGNFSFFSVLIYYESLDL